MLTSDSMGQAGRRLHIGWDLAGEAMLMPFLKQPLKRTPRHPGLGAQLKFTSVGMRLGGSLPRQQPPWHAGRDSSLVRPRKVRVKVAVRLPGIEPELLARGPAVADTGILVKAHATQIIHQLRVCVDSKERCLQMQKETTD